MRVGTRVTGAICIMAAGLLAACGSSSLLGPDAEQGIEVIALRGPVCPVEIPGEDCSPQAHQAWIQINQRDGGQVARVRTGPDGRIRVGLAPGYYMIRPESGNPFPAASDQEVEVGAGAFVIVTLLFDTGIR